MACASTRWCSARRQPADIESGAFVEHGRLINSAAFDGLEFEEAFDALVPSSSRRRAPASAA